MTDQECVQFLKWALPRIRMRWNGFRRVRGQVCKRIQGRMSEQGLSDYPDYQSFLERNKVEWTLLDSLCRVTISRFYRDREVFRSLEQEVLVRLCEVAAERSDQELRCWSIGCASGEEPYTLALIWGLNLELRYPSLKVKILATDADRGLLERAQEGCYSSGSLRELPAGCRSAFQRQGDRFCIRAKEREKVTFLEQEGRFHLILCRNLAFTYFDKDLQKEILSRLYHKLLPWGGLVLGIHEDLPSEFAGFLPWSGCRGVFMRNDAETGT